MTDKLDPVIAETIAKRRAEIAQNEASQKQAEAERESERHAHNHAAWDALEAIIHNWQPKFVPYWKRPADDEAPMVGYATMIEFTLPELAPFAAHFSFANDEWKQTASRDGKYIVTRYSEQWIGDSRKKIDSRWWHSYNNLADALVEASNEYQNGLTLEAEIAQWNSGCDAEDIAAELRQQTNAEHAEQVRHDRELRESSEREALLDLIGDDPIAITLLKLFVAVKQERAGYQQAINHLGESIDTVEEHYTKELSEAQRQAKANADRAYEAENDAATARSAAATIERQFKQQTW